MPPELAFALLVGVVVFVCAVVYGFAVRLSEYAAEALIRWLRDRRRRG